MIADTSAEPRTEAPHQVTAAGLLDVLMRDRRRQRAVSSRRRFGKQLKRTMESSSSTARNKITRVCCLPISPEMHKFKTARTRQTRAY